VDRILTEDHVAATGRIDNFCARIRQLHAERASMKRVLAVIKPVVERYAMYVKEGCRAKRHAVRALLNGKKVPWHEEDWGEFESAGNVDDELIMPREISPFCVDELNYVADNCAEANFLAEFGQQFDQVERNAVVTLPWRFWAEQIMQGLEGYMLVHGNWCKMTAEVA
jgi:hypothetical protein